MRSPTADFLRAKLKKFCNQRLDFYIRPDCWFVNSLVKSNVIIQPKESIKANGIYVTLMKKGSPQNGVLWIYFRDVVIPAKDSLVFLGTRKHNKKYRIPFKISEIHGIAKLENPDFQKENLFLE